MSKEIKERMIKEMQGVLGKKVGSKEMHNALCDFMKTVASTSMSSSDPRAIATINHASINTMLMYITLSNRGAQEDMEVLQNILSITISAWEPYLVDYRVNEEPLGGTQ